MSLDYTSTLSRTRSFLRDAGSTVWADADLQGAIRQSLQQINLYSGQAYTLNGLDAAVTTTLPAKMEGLIVLGAAAYAVTGRAINRSEVFELAGEESKTAALSASLLVEYHEQLKLVIPVSSSTFDPLLRTTTDPAWAAWKDDFGEVGEAEHS